MAVPERSSLRIHDFHFDSIRFIVNLNGQSRSTGFSVSTHINRAASAIIICYLKDSNLSVTQIAEEMKFTSLSYFSRYCQKNLGKSPSEYRLSISVKARDINE